jgi:hypothetical protein
LVSGWRHEDEPEQEEEAVDGLKQQQEVLSAEKRWAIQQKQQ